MDQEQVDAVIRRVHPFWENIRADAGRAFLRSQTRPVLDAALAEGWLAPPEAVDLREKNAELEQLFDLQWKRSTEAQARWRAEDPEARARVGPDLGRLLAWLMQQADDGAAEAERYRAALTEIRNALGPDAICACEPPCDSLPIEADNALRVARAALGGVTPAEQASDRTPHANVTGEETT